MRQVVSEQNAEPRAEEEIVARLAKNVVYLLQVNGWTQQELKGYCLARHVAPRTVDSVLAGKSNPEARTIAVVATVLGVDPGRVLLPHDELIAYVDEEGLRPLPSPRPSQSSSSSPASGASSQSRSRSRYRAKTKTTRSGKTSQGGASIRRFPHTRRHQCRHPRGRGDRCSPRTYYAQPLRPVRTLVVRSLGTERESRTKWDTDPACRHYANVASEVTLLTDEERFRKFREVGTSTNDPAIQKAAAKLLVAVRHQSARLVREGGAEMAEACDQPDD